MRYYDSFIDDDMLQIVMELSDGGNLADYLKQRDGKLLNESHVWKFFLHVRPPLMSS